MKLWFLAVIVAGSLQGQAKFVPANFVADNRSHDLRLFPKDGASAVVKMPGADRQVKFAADGRSLYAVTDQSLIRVDFKPVRYTPVRGTQGFIIVDYAVTPDGNKVVISGRHREGAIEKCGLFEITVSTGSTRYVLAADCAYHSSWLDLAVSPDGDRAVAEYGNTSPDHNSRLDLINLADGTTKSLSDHLFRPVWSPDGRWLAAIEWKSERLVLLDASDFSHRKDLGSTIEAAWSPDSRYLLVWKEHLLRCGIFLDIDAPESFEILEVATGKRSFLASSRCQLSSGTTGWIDQTLTR